MTGGTYHLMCSLKYKKAMEKKCHVFCNDEGIQGAGNGQPTH